MLMPSSALVELLHRVEAAIREYSEELISQLARREELEFEKEVKNTFITALMEVQNRQKEQRESGKRRRRDKALSLQGGGSDSTEKTGSMPTKVTSSNHLINSNTQINNLYVLESRWRECPSFIYCIYTCSLNCSRSAASMRFQVTPPPLLFLLSCLFL